MRAAVLGSPIGHSLSPALHRAGFAACGLDWSYDAIECDAGRLPELVHTAGPEWGGFSVTMPGKAAAAAVADARSSRVKALGVANTLFPSPTGSHPASAGWMAENTDVDGVLGALRAAGAARPRRALLLGGGHTARAVVAALAEWPGDSPVEVVLAGRRPESTAACAALAADFGLPVVTTGFSALEVGSVAADCDLLVSTVPAGGADSLARQVAGIPTLLDVVYSPWPTVLASVGSPGRVIVSGLDMLLHQAFRQFQLFTGLPAPRREMRVGLLRASGSSLSLPI